MSEPAAPRKAGDWWLVGVLLAAALGLLGAGGWLYWAKGQWLGVGGAPVEEARLNEYTRPMVAQFEQASRNCAKLELDEQLFLESYLPELKRQFVQAGGDVQAAVFGEFPNAAGCYYMADSSFFVYQQADGQWVKMAVSGEKKGEARP